MTQSHRLYDGGRVDRSQPINFTFNGRRYTGVHGDTLASALLANGVMLVGRSFKYHRPRGIFSAGTEEPNALVQLERGPRTIANLLATRIPLYEGLDASSVNSWPSPNFDLMAITGLYHRLYRRAFIIKPMPTSLWSVPALPVWRRHARRHFPVHV